MAKRFTDSDKWKDAWFLELEPYMKLLYLYVLDNCDCSGVWKVNFRLASFSIGSILDKQSALKALGSRIRVVSEDLWFIEKFIRFQYPSGLSTDCKAHVGVLKALKYHGIESNCMDRVRIELGNSIHTVQDKDKDKDKDQDKDMDKEKEKETKRGKKPAKESTTKKPEYSPLETLYLEASPDPDIIAWLRSGLPKVQFKLLDLYDPSYLRETLEKAYFWQLENKRRGAGAFLSSWVDRDNNKILKGRLSKSDSDLEKFFKDADAKVIPYAWAEVKS